MTLQHRSINADLGTDLELAELVGRVQRFDHDNASMDDNMALAQALRVIAADVTTRHARVVQMEATLRGKIATVDVASELSAVLAGLAGPKPRRKFLGML